MLEIKKEVWKTTAVVITVVIGGATLGYYLFNSQKETTTKSPQQRVGGINAEVVKIVDGDTIYIKWLSNNTTAKVRIYGIDTPEKYYTGKLYYDAKRCNATPNLIHKLGVLASNHAQLYLQPNQFVKVIPKGEDKYHRLIAIVKLENGTDFGLGMIKDGYSCVYWKDTKPNYITFLKKAEIEKKGLWGNYTKLMECLCY